MDATNQQGPPVEYKEPVYDCLTSTEKDYKRHHKMDIDLGDPCSGCGSDNCAKCSLCGFESHD